MFGRRADATMVKDLSTMRAFMPFISPRRNESLVYYKQEVDPTPALRFVEEYNRTAPEDQQITFFMLMLRAIATALNQRPGINRFVAGGRLWQRDEVWLTFSAKVQLADRSPLVTVKRLFPPDESLEDMVGDILRRLRRRRGGERQASDKEMSLALRFPASVSRLAVWLLHRANMLGLLPKKMIDDDPLFTTVFVANLGSVDMESAYHHLWEYGTCSIFAMVGRINDHWSGKPMFEMKYSYDERMNDGLYGGISMRILKEAMENPEKLV